MLWYCKIKSSQIDLRPGELKELIAPFFVATKLVKVDSRWEGRRDINKSLVNKLIVEQQLEKCYY